MRFTKYKIRWHREQQVNWARRKQISSVDAARGGHADWTRKDIYPYSTTDFSRALAIWTLNQFQKSYMTANIYALPA